MNIIHKHKGETSQQQMLDLLLRFDSVFTPPHSESVDLEQYSAKLSRYACLLTVEEDDGSVVGFMAYYRNDDLHQLYVTIVCVDNAYQHKGIGSRLFERLESLASPGYTTIGLEVVKTNTKAYNFYKKHHFIVQEDRGTKLLMLKKLLL